MQDRKGNKGSPDQTKEIPWTKEEMEEAEPLPMPTLDDEDETKEPKKKK